MADNRNIELNDDAMAKAAGGTGRADVTLFKVGERVVYLDGGGMIGKIRDVIPNENNLSDSRYNIIFSNEVKRNIRHTRLRKAGG